MRSLFVLFFCAISFLSHAGIKLDSIRTESKDGKQFILHEVEERETLYTVSRKYNTPIYAIIENNPPTEFGLEVGQVIRIPIIIKKKKTATIKPPVAKSDPIDIKTEEPKADKPKENRPITTEAVVTQVQEIDIEHVVQPGETMFAISRKYEVSVAEIKEWNDLETNALSIGQKILIKTKAKQETIKESTPVNARTHVVQPSETLYGISRLYEVAVNDLKLWNELANNEISIGQQLIVSKPDLTVETEKPEVVIETVDDVTKEDTSEVASVIDTARYNIQPEVRTNFEEVIESGLAEKITGTSGNRKYLALHRTAKTGTIMKVKNEMNDQEVFVRVIGPLPDTGVNKNVVIKISKAAYDSLGAIDPKFRVTVTYIP